jgi:hypothetical protein
MFPDLRSLLNVVPNHWRETGYYWAGKPNNIDWIGCVIRIRNRISRDIHNEYVYFHISLYKSIHSGDITTSPRLVLKSPICSSSDTRSMTN